MDIRHHTITHHYSPAIDAALDRKGGPDAVYWGHIELIQDEAPLLLASYAQVRASLYQSPYPAPDWVDHDDDVPF